MMMMQHSRRSLSKRTLSTFGEESDSLGSVRVPLDKLWGAQTQRSLDNFPIGGPGEIMPFPVIRALGILKITVTNRHRHHERRH